jgi:hypothetical protein
MYKMSGGALPSKTYDPNNPYDDILYQEFGLKEEEADNTDLHPIQDHHFEQIAGFSRNDQTRGSLLGMMGAGVKKRKPRKAKKATKKEDVPYYREFGSKNKALNQMLDATYGKTKRTREDEIYKKQIALFNQLGI